MYQNASSNIESCKGVHKNVNTKTSSVKLHLTVHKNIAKVSVRMPVIMRAGICYKVPKMKALESDKMLFSVDGIISERPARSCFCLLFFY